jgi:hypothetical protein
MKLYDSHIVGFRSGHFASIRVFETAQMAPFAVCLDFGPPLTTWLVEANTSVSTSVCCSLFAVSRVEAMRHSPEIIAQIVQLVLIFVIDMLSFVCLDEQ